MNYVRVLVKNIRRIKSAHTVKNRHIFCAHERKEILLRGRIFKIGTRALTHVTLNNAKRIRFVRCFQNTICMWLSICVWRLSTSLLCAVMSLRTIRRFSSNPFTQWHRFSFLIVFVGCALHTPKIGKSSFSSGKKCVGTIIRHRQQTHNFSANKK